MPHPDLPVARPLLGGEEEAAVLRVLRSGWIMQGPEVTAFEREFAEWVGATHACAVSSGTAALHLALLAVGVRPDDEVITVSHSFVATANCVRLCGATPRFVDVALDTLNIDPDAVQAAIGPRTRAILCVHQLGMPADFGRLGAIAAAHRLPLVEDAACAVGSEWRADEQWQRIGRPHGAVACFSFHPRKVLTTGEGGMVTTRDPEIDARVRAWRQHESRDGITAANHRMTDLQAAVGRVQLGRLESMVAERRRLAAKYRHGLADVARLQAEPPWARSNWQSLCVRFASADAARAVAAALDAERIAWRPGIANAHEPPLWPSREPPPSLPHSERATRESLLLPIFAGMSDGDVERVVAAVRRALA